MKRKFYWVIIIIALGCIFAFYMHPTINLEQKNTIEAPLDTVTNRDILVAIQNNTFTDPVDSGFDNIYGLATIALAALAFIVSIFTFWAQVNTEEHTKNTPYRVQEGILRDLPRHLYRNLVCTIAIVREYESSRKSRKKVRRYPSEANLLKLQTLPEEILLKMDISEKDSVKVYAAMHETTLLFRNYNNEIISASQHFGRPKIDTISVYSDYDNLLFKPCYLMKASLNLNKLFSKSISGYNKKAQTETMVMASILLEHVLKGKPLTPKTNENTLQDTLKDLESDSFKFNLFDYTKLGKDKTEPIERSFKEQLFKEQLFKDKVIVVKLDDLFAAAKGMCIRDIDKNKWEQFEKSIKDGNIEYGLTLNKNTYVVNFWNLFKIMCYLDSEAEKSKIGMINVA